MKYLSSGVSSLVDSVTDDCVVLSDPRLLTWSGFRLAIGVDCTSVDACSSPRRGFLVGRLGSLVVSVEEVAGFLIKGDLKGLKTMIELVFFP